LRQESVRPGVTTTNNEEKIAALFEIGATIRSLDHPSRSRECWLMIIPVTPWLYMATAVFSEMIIANGVTTPIRMASSPTAWLQFF
jgi:hypothetical protein